MWNPTEHTDDENVRWSHLRAMEWGFWPIFISQPIAPLAIVFFDWWRVVIGVLIIGILWALFIQGAFVLPTLAFWGALIVRLKWIACPACACVLWLQGRRIDSIIALLWPLLILASQLPVALLGRIRIGDTQALLLRSLGYEPKE